MTCTIVSNGQIEVGGAPRLRVQREDVWLRLDVQDTSSATQRPAQKRMGEERIRVGRQDLPVGNSPPVPPLPRAAALLNLCSAYEAE